MSRLSLSPVVALAERAAEQGAVTAVVVFIDRQGEVDFSLTEGVSEIEAIGLLAVAQHELLRSRD